jgi:hypothetical protein
VPVLSNATIDDFFIFSKTELLLIRIPFLIATLSTIAITLGTAKPNAHGHEATKMPIPLSTIQQILHPSTSTKLKLKRKSHTTMTNKLKNMTDLTKYLEMVLQISCIPEET